ncbi:stretch-activated cation channel Mid1 [Crassisporium funariophilum]|nr:stretch-activated cation channel Mid1 [Crassisporium funariophilum]
MLPESLLCLLSASITYAQATQALALNSVASFNSQRLPNPPLFSLPQQQEQLSITIALCSDSSSKPRFFVSNSSDTATPDDSGSTEIQLQDGNGSWNGRFANGGVLSVDTNGAEGVSFDIGVSTNGPIHGTLTALPFFGDTTSNQAILSSPPFLKIPLVEPSYPNYTLPAANMLQPSQPTTFPNLTVIISPTSFGIANGPRTGCFLSAQQTSGTIANETLWARDEEGWRRQWLMGGLTPSTNYTAFVLQDTTKVSGPIYFSTKSAAFTCPLVHSLSYCPGVAYTVPLPAPPNGDIAYDSTNLPTTLTTPLLSYLANFTTTLTTFACGRDWYSPIMGCDDCQREYRKWLCSISFTRCSEPSPGNPNGFTATPAQPSATGLSASVKTDVSGAQRVLSALLPQETRDTQRNPFLPAMGSPYMMLLPCLEQCNAVDRACPPFVGFKCPTNNFNAAASYGVGYIDSADGDQFGGITGSAQDRWGNVWCNMI